MGSSAVRSFSDPDDYAHSVRATSVRLTVAERGNFAARLTRIDLGDLWMQRFSSNLAWVAHASNMRNRAVFFFRTGPGPSIYRGKREVLAHELTRLEDGETSFLRTAGSASFASMSLPISSAETLSAALSGTAPPKSSETVEPDPAALGRLLKLHAAAGHLARDAPEILANPNAALGLGQELLQALAGCLVAGSRPEDDASSRRHALIMRRFHEKIAQHGDRAIYIPELCLEIGVSERTLRACCVEHLGMGPNRYLWYRRMQLAHRALRKASPKETSVTAVATDLGFWELGRFAVSYRALYGETPSVTLSKS
jgi:AraC-like DNA-binding protein